MIKPQDTQIAQIARLEYCLTLQKELKFKNKIIRKIDNHLINNKTIVRVWFFGNGLSKNIHCMMCDIIKEYENLGWEYIWHIGDIWHTIEFSLRNNDAQ